ncbi:MAG: aldehyde dehydrogenase family protein [Methanocorpusculum sp.]|uniref:aldehyde dehydrogenase family protein n=1 Tax=Methanocorpusculum sp. TaxID=2058474 RepID=UPI00271A7EBD|nr:aldehyde dehydrogenase family protein [Methanocorpusculum sp.]MDO9522436.1 aldehyde dehydrogenase family protein [Methanocorpusculum sp.]
MQPSLDVRNPATNEVIGTIHNATPDDVDNFVNAAADILPSWEKTAASKRAVMFVNAAALIRARADDLAVLLTTEQGKPLREAKDEILGSAHVFEYYASVSGSIPGDARNLPGYGYLNVVRKPLGICAAIIPWNMPVMIFAWKVGAALTCGNTVLAKPSKTASLTILKIAEAMHDGGFPKKVLQVVTGSGEGTGSALVTHPDIRHISFTGSIMSGKAVSLLAAPHLKKLTLELGGNDSFIVTKTADVDAAVKAAVRNRFYNCGQVCTSAKRILVDASLADEFVRKAEIMLSGYVVGNGLDKVNMGPMNNPGQLAEIEASVESILANGDAQLVYGGKKLDMPGNFYAPTLLKNVSPLAVSEEIFGPVMSVIPFKNADEALDIANSTVYGLGSSVWTSDIATAQNFAESLRCGVVWVNKHLTLPPEMPFGGVASSGFGRENGRDFVYEYTEPKSILFG